MTRLAQNLVCHGGRLLHRLAWILLAPAILVTGMSLAGCQQDWAAAMAHWGEKPGPPDDFAAGANRAPTANTLIALSQVLACQGRDADCEAVLHRLLADYPDCQAAYVELAQCHMRQHDSARAADVLDKALLRWPGNPSLLNNLGMCHLMAHEYTVASKAFAQAHDAQPAQATYQTNLALALGMSGKYDEALVQYQGALPPADAHYNLGLLCQARGDTKRALDEFALSRSAKSAPPPANP